MTYLHLALHEDVTQFSSYAPIAVGLARAFVGMSVQEPPDDEDGGGGGGDDDDSNPTEINFESDNKDEPAIAPPSEKEASTSTENDPQQPQPIVNEPAYPECWFEDEESGTPLRWHIFAGVLYDLMKGRAIMDSSPWKGASNEPAQHNLLPWRVRVHFTSYPDQLLPLDDGLAHVSSDDGIGDRITGLVRRMFRNSLKQALFMQYASSKVAMSMNKTSHEKIWDALLKSNYESYHEVNVGLQSGIKSPPVGIQSTTNFAATDNDEQRSGTPHLIPLRFMLNGLPAIQKPIKHGKDSNYLDAKRPSEILEKLGTYQALPYTTLGDVLAECLPDHFAIDPSTGRVAAVTGSNVYCCVQGVQPNLNCAVVDLWRALSHPDHFLYIIAVTTSLSG